MSTTALDRLLAILVVALVTTGLLSLRAGAPHTAPLFVIHGLLAGTLVTAFAMKLKRSVPAAVRAHRWGRLALASVVTLLTAAALSGGFLWVANGRIISIGPFTVLTLHIWAGLALVPFLAVHLLPRRWLLLRPRAWRRRRAERAEAGDVERHLISRRALLTGGLLAVAAVVAWGGAAAVELIRGGQRRFTGSRWLPRGGIPPPTTFFGEGTPEIDHAAWRLSVAGRVARPATYSLDELRALGETQLTAVLDCTSGWVMETDWWGVRTATLLDAAAPLPTANTVTVRSVTGWYANLPLDEARRTLLATAVAGQPLPADNGAPCRLVAPDRRGLEWVKWVTELEVA